jgi:uncharacterized protein involved in type VI secretion and phage assembly
MKVQLEQVVAELVAKLEHRFLGKYRGFVVDNADPELLGRLKLQVPSVLGEEVVTGWAMPCLPYGGGPDQGLLFLPEVDAGVWVEFEEGDLEFPVWVGTFWSKPGGDSELPRPNQADGSEAADVQDPPTRKILKTRKGHTIQLEDADEEESIHIQEATHGHVVVMDKDGLRITVGGQEGHHVTLDGAAITIVDSEGNELAMDADGIALRSAGDVTISGKNVTVEATAKLAASGNPIHLNP